MTSPLVISIAKLVVDVLESPIDDVAIAKGVVDVLLSSGIAPAILSDYLTAAGAQSADDFTDIAEEAKLKAEELAK